MLSLRFLLRQLSPYVVRATLAPGRDVCPVRTELLHDQTVLLADRLYLGHLSAAGAVLARAELLHEFNGRGVSRVEGRRLNALSLRGTSGRLTLGLTYTDETKGLSAALAGFAQGGQEDGWGLKFNGSLRF